MNNGGRRAWRRTQWRTWLSGAVAAVCLLGGGCSQSGNPTPRAQGPSDAAASSSTTAPTSTTTTTTTAPLEPTFAPLIADPDLSPHAQVEAAYLYYWEVLLDAYRTGETRNLPLVYIEPMLQIRVEEIEGLVAAGHRVHGGVEHNYEITMQGPDEAILIDYYLNNLILVDATGEPLEEPPNERVLDEHVFRKVDGRWMVEDLIGYQLPDE